MSLDAVLNDVPEQITDSEVLNEWGIYIRSQKNPWPTDTPKSQSFWAGGGRDEDDPVIEPSFNYDRADMIDEMILIASERRPWMRIILHAWFCEWPSNLTLCVKHYRHSSMGDISDSSNPRINAKLSPREFSQYLNMAINQINAAYVRFLSNSVSRELT